MKAFFIPILLLALFSIQCSKSNSKSNPKSDSKLPSKVITESELNTKKIEIVNFINSLDCSGSCNFIAFGSKACGGPKEYLLFSSKINQPQLEKMVAEYNEMERQFNIQTNAVSDCAMLMPPNKIECVNGKCVIIN